jgi:hypothetical protein
MVARRPSFGRIDWPTVPLHPLGMAAFPVVFLFAENAAQQVSLRPLWGPLALALLGGLVTLLVCSALLRDWLRGALLASLVLALFFSFGHAWNLVGDSLRLRYLAGAYALVGLASGIVVWRGGGWVRPTTTVLNIAVLALVVFNAARIGPGLAGQPAASARDTGPTPAVAVDPSVPRRDIYYLILDRYANAETLRELYGFDNRPFLDALQQRGFVIAKDSWANYWKTAFSVMASMSMEYLDPGRFDTTEPPTFAPLHAALQGRLPVPVTLKALGYEYIHLGNYWEPTSTNVDADLSLRYEGATEFDDALRSTTALMLLDPPSRRDRDPETAPYGDLARGTTLFAFDRLEAAVDRTGPTFVFAHFLLPHPPYVFDTDGSLPSPEMAASRTEEDQYVRQLQWTNARVLQAIDRLRDVPAGEEPIIILQADEGPWPPAFTADQCCFRWLDATPRQVQQKYGILNAFHLPGVDAAEAGLSDRTSPVNEFRIVFNAYFGAELPLLPDRAFLSPDYARMYDFVEYPRK